MEFSKLKSASHKEHSQEIILIQEMTFTKEEKVTFTKKGSIDFSNEVSSEYI